MCFYFKKLTTAQLIKLRQIGEKATTKPDRLIIEVKCSLSVIKYYPIYSAGYNTVKCEVTDTDTGRVQPFTFSPQPSGEETGELTINCLR